MRLVRSTLLLSTLLAVGCPDGLAPGRDSGRTMDTGPISNDTGRPQEDTGSDVGSDAPQPVRIDAATACGNSRIEGTEECEGSNLNGEDCVSQGYASGTLSCNADCTFNKTACTEDPCGNGRIDAGEACDGMTLAGATCVSRGFVAGELRCSATCSFDTSACTSCGNGHTDSGEECDGTDFDAATCASRGFTGGALSCTSTCGINDSACFRAACGNGSREPSEDCDGSDLGGRNCMSYGFAAGTLSCNAMTCTANLAACNNCGNNRVDGIEQCDGTDLAGATCTSRGFTMGTLRCDTRCGFDTTGCSTAACGNGRLESGETCDDGNVAGADGCTGCVVDAGYRCAGTPSSCTPVCGDGMIRGAEECDGSSLAGQTCATRGFPGGGTLSCNATACTFNTSACRATTCGNRAIDAGEECDDGNTLGNDGCTSSCQVDASFYLPVRLRNGDGTNHGMLEVNYGGAWRDVCDDTYDVSAQQAMANIVCRQLGFTGTGHQFLTSFGGGSGSPVMDDVVCTGTEGDLSQCAFAGWGVENCSASEAVGIRCMPGEGDVRLVGGPSGMEGRLQTYHSGAWGEVCDDYFDGAYGSSYFGYSTTTVCQQMGYAGGTFLSTYDAPSATFVLDDVNCTGTERRIGDCPHLAYGTENCGATEGAGFRCDIYMNNAARLVGASARNSGRIEILHNQVWGTVCDDFISTAGTRQTNMVNVTCGQLGFSRAGSALLTSSVPDGVDPTWLDDLNCAGTETTLAMCPNPGWAVENCSHIEDIGVTCTP